MGKPTEVKDTTYVALEIDWIKSKDGYSTNVPVRPEPVFVHRPMVTHNRPGRSLTTDTDLVILGVTPEQIRDIVFFYERLASDGQRNVGEIRALLAKADQWQGVFDDWALSRQHYEMKLYQEKAEERERERPAKK